MSVEIRADLGANVWMIVVAVGDRVLEGEPLMILESMKMEIPVSSEDEGTVTKLHVAEGEMIEAGQILAELD